MAHRGFETKIWNEERDAILRELYPTTPAVDIAEMFGCSDTAVSYRAKKLGLQRDPSFCRNNFIGRYTGKGHYKPEDL